MNSNVNTSRFYKNSFFNRIFNVTPDEWPRIAISWSLLFFYRVGYIIGWTIMITMVISRFGIIGLPYFIILNSIFRVMGAFFYSNFINRYKKENILLFTILAGIGFLIASLVISKISLILFLLLGLFTLSVFYTQIYIIGSAFIEDLFTPLESERTFPIIESSETFGGVIGGLLVALFAMNGPISNFVYLMIVCLTFIGPIILFYRSLLKKLPFIQFRKTKTPLKFNFEKIKKSFNHLKNIPFLKVLLLIVLTQWIFVHLLEYQYTGAVYNNISPDISNQEQSLAHGLGTLYVVIHGFALLMQLLVASRIITTLGIMSSLLLHPIVTLLGLGTMLFSYGFTSAVVTKLNFEVTNIIHKNAYHSSYYAIEPNIREHVREFLEGFAQPAGAIIGMIALIILQNLFTGAYFTFSLTVLMTSIMAFMAFIIISNESKYTHTSVKNLLQSGNTLLQLNAVEILGQNGHRSATEILTKTLKNNQLDDIVKVKIINTLAHIRDIDTVIDILDCLESKSTEVKIASLNALNSFLDMQFKDNKFPFSNHRINDELMNLLKIDSSSLIKSLVINILAKLQNHKIVPFLLQTIRNSDIYLQTDCIELCSHFNDINLAHYLLPYLESTEPKVVASTIVALWQFKKYRPILSKALKELMYSSDNESIKESYYVFGEIKALQEKVRLSESLNDANSEIRLAASFALAKMDIYTGIDEIVEYLMNSTIELQKHLIEQINQLPKKAYEKIHEKIRSKVSAHINNLLILSQKSSLEELDNETLFKLKNAYELVNDHEEVQNIKEILHQKEQFQLLLQFNPT